MRCPSADQPGAGSNVRGMTGPSSSVQTVVEPSGGAVEWVTTAVLLRQNPCHEESPNCGSAATSPLRAAGCGGSDCV
jgi:hypothetical protein